MYPTFVQPASLFFDRNVLRARTFVRTRFNVSVHRTRRSVITATQGWNATRLAVPSIELSTSESGTLGLPGVHFVEPPSVTTEDLLKIVRGETPDEWVNEILRTLLGWRQLQDGVWNDELVPQEWKEAYPDRPPNFIGKLGDYTPATDRPVKKAMQKLSRSIPSEHKQIFKEVLKPKGFAGWKVSELTPNRTRRATAVNWILYWYRVHYPEYQWS